MHARPGTARPRSVCALAAAALTDNQASYDDARCDLAMVQTKIGNVLLKMGKAGEAANFYDNEA